ncbi:hypothetical protein EON82_09830 [bacterium]|nr:MAG: hypothetical protein EON82_09830 [bacterium]
MNRPRIIAFGLLAATALVGCGGGGGLFATVPPPVEFIGSLLPGLTEVPKAGMYTGTVSVARVEFVYTPATDTQAGEWNVVSSDEVEGASAAEAIVAADGSVQLRKVGGARNLFVGTLQVVEKPTVYGSTTADLVAFDGTKGTYPYLLQDTSPLRLDLMPRANVRWLSKTRIAYDRYTFSLTQQ